MSNELLRGVFIGITFFNLLFIIGISIYYYERRQVLQAKQITLPLSNLGLSLGYGIVQIGLVIATFNRLSEDFTYINWILLIGITISAICAFLSLQFQIKSFTEKK